MIIHQFIHKLFIFFAGSQTPNKRYKRLVEAVIQKECQHNSLCIDVGANDGFVLQLLIKHCPGAMHYAFETDDRMYFLLVRKFGSAAHIYKFIPHNILNKQRLLYEVTGAEGSKKENLPAKDLNDCKTLDSIIPPDEMVRLIKLDFGDNGYNVLMSALGIIERCRPIILLFFEPGDNDINFENAVILLNSLGFHVNHLNGFMQQKEPMNKLELQHELKKKRKHFFIAYPIG